MGNRKDQTRASGLHQGSREAQKENKTMMAAFSILAIFTAYATAGPVPTTKYNNHEPEVSTKPFRHTAPSVTCRTEYVVLWSTKFEEREEQVCQTLVQNLCRPTSRQECHTKQTEVCKEIKRNVCVQKFKTEYQPYTESECTTEYKQDCQYAWKGIGNDKVWAPIEGTCQNVPYDSCKEVAKTQARQVAYQECHDVPERKCSLVPEQVCVNVPDEVCQQVPKQQCHSEHKKLPIRISRQEAKKVCNVPGQPKPHHLWHQVFLWLLCQPLGHPLLCQAHHLSTSSPPLKISCHLISSEEYLSKTKTIMPALMIQPQRCKR